MLFKALPVIGVVVFGQQSIDIARLEGADVCNEKVDKLRWYVIMDGVDKFDVCNCLVAHFGIIHHR